MSPLRQAREDCLSIRRAMGFKLDRAERLLTQFIGYLEKRQASTVTLAPAMDWATAPGGASSWWWAMRMTHIRPFAVYLSTTDASTEVPPPGLIAYRRARATTYRYSGSEIRTLARAATRLPQRLPASTYPALISLLAVTGMRIGEVLAIQVEDLDLERDDEHVTTLARADVGGPSCWTIPPITVRVSAGAVGQVPD
jgi:integrase/recombinase XerD